nr:site-specific integrase [uncultured Undibacterium sp.]
MASIINRGPYQFQVLIRRKGYPTQTRTFESQKDAKDWARDVEAKMRRGEFADLSEAEATTLGEILERYRQEVTPEKRGHVQENYRVLQLIRHPISMRSLASLRNVDFSDYRNERIKQVGPKTVQLELALLSAVLNNARRDWSIPIENSVTDIRKPKLPRGRDRRLVGDEEVRLFEASEECKSDGLGVCIRLALELGMRRGEIANLQWSQVDFEQHVIRLDLTKNGDARLVPMSTTAEAAIRSLYTTNCSGRIFDFFDSDGLGKAFSRARKRAGIVGLCFHDLRHEAASRWAKRVPVATLAKIFGWKTLQMAMRYYNPTAAELVAAVREADERDTQPTNDGSTAHNAHGDVKTERRAIGSRPLCHSLRTTAVSVSNNVIQVQFNSRSAV